MRSGPRFLSFSGCGTASAALRCANQYSFMKLKMGQYAQIAGLGFLMVTSICAAELAGTVELTVTNGTKQLQLPVVAGVDEFKVLTTTNLAEPFREAAPGALSGYHWEQPGQLGLEFFKVEMRPKDSNALLNATLLNRIAYGPTPDELERLAQIGPDAYIAEQLAAELIEENLEIDRIVSSDDWQYVVQSGTATSSSLYIYLTGAGDCYIDDLKIVSGGVPEVGVNRVQNGDFENGLTGWTVSPNLALSTVVTDMKHSGDAALHVDSTEGGTTRASSIYRADLGLSNGQPYTLSYWYKPGASGSAPLVIRLSGEGILSTPGSIATRLFENSAELTDLAAWHTMHAVQSKKQLLEVMLQFLENHFVTQHAKSEDYLDRYYEDGEDDIFATNLEYRELERWRQALLDPNCTFHDLLKISAESPGMIIYLDTVSSRGDGANIANENYARELLELFTFGVDNGYDQNDITVMSGAWTGWRVEIVDYTNEFNPFATISETRRPGTTNEPPERADLLGVWALNFQPGRHANGPKVLFPGKTVPARFSAPYAGRNYELRLASGGTNWIHVTERGEATSSTLYIYMTGTGDCYIDDIKIVPGNTPDEGENFVRNGSFNSNLTGWTLSPNLSGSTVTTDAHSAPGALHVVSTEGGRTSSSAIRQGNLGLTNGQPYTLSYWFKPGASMNGNLVLRLSGRGIESTPGGGTNSIQEGYQVLAHLADQPFTQEYISVKLCRLLVHDDFRHGYDFTDPNLSPEGRLVRECMAAWENGNPKGQIRDVLRVILNSELFRSQGGSMQKVKTPFEFTVSAVRALRARASDGTYTADSDGYGISGRGNISNYPINRMGRMRLFDREEPDGYPEAGAPWISAGTLTERLRFAQALLLANTGSDARGNRTHPVSLLKTKLPQASWRDAGAVAAYFTNILFPSEGRANLDEYRQMAVWFLNTGDTGAASAFSGLDPNSIAYDTRVRGMVAMLMTFPRFQEQ